MGKTVVRTEAAPAPFQGAPYSQAIVAGGFVFVSGQVALEPGHTELMGGTIGEQTEQVFANLRAILEAAGSGLDQLVKTTVYLAEPRRLRRHERGLFEARRRPAAGAGDVRSGGPARGRARRDRGHRSRIAGAEAQSRCHAGRDHHRHAREHRLRRVRVDARRAPPLSGVGRLRLRLAQPQRQGAVPALRGRAGARRGVAARARRASAG